MLFGNRVNELEEAGTWENFQTNGMSTFSSQADAFRAKTELAARGIFKRVRVTHLFMEVCETDEEIGLLAGKKSLVAVVKNADGSVEFLGAEVEGKRRAYPLPGAYLWANGLKPFRYFSDALYAAREANRQSGAVGSGLSVTVATFYLRNAPRQLD